MELKQLIETEYQNISGMVVFRKGEVVHESYYNGYGPDDTVHVASVTKSVFSTLIGVAVDKGYIKSVDQRVLDFFPEYAVPEGEQTIQRVTIRDMLTMTAPYKYDVEPYIEFFKSGNWLKTALDLLGGEGRIGDFLYAAMIGTHILSGILVRATGQPVFDFAVEHLFTPLSIHVARSVILHDEAEHAAFFQGKTASGWAADEQGINPAGWGLTLTAMDMAKIGQLYLNGGVWQGKRIVSAQWIADCTREHSRWAEAGLRYGYLWWIADLNGVDAYCAMGDGGNVICCIPEKEVAVAIASTWMTDPGDRLALIAEHILPMVCQA